MTTIQDIANHKGALIITKARSGQNESGNAATFF
jgi:hypothetical protein